jgi:hypothetical protein
MKPFVLFILIVAAAFSVALAEASISPEDRVAIVGLTFADQIRNHGYLETFLSPRIRENPLSIRNLNGERAKSPTVAIDLEKGRQEITLSTDFRKLRGGFRAEFKTVDEEAHSAPEGGI